MEKKKEENNNEKKMKKDKRKTNKQTKKTKNSVFKLSRPVILTNLRNSSHNLMCDIIKSQKLSLTTRILALYLAFLSSATIS